MKKLLSVFLSVLLVIQLVVPVWAGETAADAALAVGTRVSGVQNNPLYGEGEGGPASRITARQLYASGAASADDYFTEEADVLEAIAAGMEKRKATITVPWRISEDDASTEDELLSMILAAFALAVSHTGTPTRGDSLLWAYESMEYSGEVVEAKDGYCYVKATYKLRYYTTAAQEKELTTKLEQVMASFNFTEETNVVTKIETIYRYICKNVSYDKTHANDETYTLKFTPYAALVKGKAVCQGYALLLYRMLLMAGVDNRVISGVANGVGHAWNIAAVNNFYYNLDSTWDAGAADYSYLLRNPEMFPGHTRDAAYDTAEFHAFYPMGRETYPTTDIWTVFAGGCGENVTWELTNDGILTISGSGAMDDYTAAEEAPWYDQRNYILGVVVEEGVTHVGDYAFAGYPSLYAVSVASGTVGNQAFCKCNALLAVDLLEGVTDIGERAFAECASLMAVSFPSTLQSVGGESFHSCVSLSSVSCAARTIGKDAFNGCESLVSVNLLEGVEEIGACAFFTLQELRAVHIPSSVKTIGNSAFGNCYFIEEVHIEDLAAWCQISFGSNPLYYGQNLYLNGERVTDLVIPDTVTAISSKAFEGGIFQSVTIPGSVKTIEGSAFNGAKITTLSLSEGLESVGASAFSDSALTSVVLPSTLQKLGSDAFSGRTLKTITFKGDAPDIGFVTFRNVTATAYYPAGNDTWTEAVRQQYGGKITWVAVCQNHVAQTIPAVAPSCSATGLTEGVKCSVCGEILTAQETVAKLPHTFVDEVCTVCGAPERVPGDFTGDDLVTNEDVSYLLWHTLFPEEHPLDNNGDLTGDGFVTNEDVSLLLWHTLFPEEYPL